ncbi:MAG TPA: ThiF family adenylyltransferase [Candidatus Acidoferrales bacterium]|nr:ThiF family adenylyltransferase [Candidatus Acidoferrales bacterium]
MNSREKERYSRQILFGGIGERGQEQLLAGSAVLVGCGAMGTSVANLLVRAGIGTLRVIDRDFVEASNLQRQTLFEESDARDNLPKAVAAERRLRAINSGARIEGVVADLTPENARDLVSGYPMILDGTDNFETRLLINDAAIALRIPWIYAAAVASTGVTMTIFPGETPCLACLLESSDASATAGAGAEETCDTAGILNAAVNAIASIEATEATKILIGKRDALHGRLISFDVWRNVYRAIRVARNPDCRACVRRDFTYLESKAQPHITMCGRDSVQIHERGRRLDLAELNRRLASAVSEIRGNDFLLRFRVNSYEVTVFSDGRAIFKGTRDPSVARSLYSRYIGT